MARREHRKAGEDVTVVSNYDELLTDLFPECATVNDENLRLPVNQCKKSRGAKNQEAKSDANAVPCQPTKSAMPTLERAASQGAYFDFRSLDPDHTVGRTRVPWHSKSASDLRDVVTTPTRIVAFDVGGTLFRCKESLIAKYPLKRLHQIIRCGCGKSSCLDDAFFIDRNPQHFEMILDWYRTEKLVRQRNVDEQAFKDDAIYFDLYDELFPSIGPGEPLSWPSTKSTRDGTVRRRSVNDVDLTSTPTKRVSMFATMASSPLPFAKKEATLLVKGPDSHDVRLPTSPSDTLVRFVRRERRVLTPQSLPLVYMMRPCEHLLVASVKGRGQLMLRVCDGTGMQTVDVSEAVLFDTLDRDHPRAPLQPKAVLPGNHVYTFWVVETATGTCTKAPASVPLALEIEVQLIFTFNAGDRVTDTVETELARAALEGNDALGALTQGENRHSRKRCESRVPCLFMPPLQDKGLTVLSDATTNTMSSSTKVSPLHKTKQGRRGSHDVHASMLRPSLGRGCLLTRPEKQSGTDTVYDRVEVHCTGNRTTLLELHAHKHNSNQDVEATYRDMQPRLFR